MSAFLETIATQQARIARMVDVLDAQLDSLRDSGRDPDYHLLREIARYFCHYPTSIHYPFEERLYARLVDARPSLRKKADLLRRRHARHARLAADVFALLDGACSGHLVPRDRLLKEANAYVVLQRDHMIPQSGELIKLAADALQEHDIDAVEKDCDAHADREVRRKIEDEFSRMETAIFEETSAAA